MLIRIRVGNRAGDFAHADGTVQAILPTLYPLAFGAGLQV
jgi:hypothetical protein